MATLAVVIAFRAAFGGYFMLDDFGMMSIARFLESPLQPFYQQHVPGGVFYRPVGMLLWWLSERLFGTTASLHYMLNLGLHLCVAAALYSVILKLAENRWLALLAAIAFASHPIGLGTAAWLSDRFDLLSLLFGLLGLRCALDFSDTASSRSLAACTVLLGLSLLSKEIGLALVLTTAGYLLVFSRDLRLALRWRAVAVLLLLLAGYWFARSMVLSSPTGGALMTLNSPLQLLSDGVSHWAAGWIQYSSYWQQMHGWRAFATASGLALLAFLVIVALFQPWTRRRVLMIALGMSVVAATALLQWPLLGFITIPFADDAKVIERVVNSRYFYTTLAGFLIAMAGVLEPLGQRGRVVVGMSSLMFSLLVLAWLGASQHLLRQYRNETLLQRDLVQSANAHIRTFQLKQPGCQIYLLDVKNWAFTWVSDEAIKATYPELDAIGRCLIQTEHTPWYHITSVDDPDPGFWLPLQFAHGHTFKHSSSAIGRGYFVGLNLMSDSKINIGTPAYYLAWQNDNFVDVSDEVRAGRRVPRFLCNRSADECH